MSLETDVCAEIRANLLLAKKADGHNRTAYRDNLKFLNLDQWEPQEARKRNNKRLMLTADQLNAPVDQIVNSVRQNKPGPVVSPAGGGTDKEAADIMAGILRRIDYDNRSWMCFETAMENATGGNFGCWEVGLEYKNDRSFSRVITVTSIPNANEMVFFDPSAIEKDRSDALWAIQIVAYSPQKYKEQFPESKAAKQGVMKSVRSFFDSFRDNTLGGWVTEDTIQVAKYWKVQFEKETLRMYTNGVCYWDSEADKIPAGVERKPDVDPRYVQKRKVVCYITNGVEFLRKPYDWPGMFIPLFPVYGRERWVENKRFITSMIQGAKQAQQAFNYAFTGACEVLATTTKSPWIGLLGQFKSKYLQWKNANTDIAAFLEYDEVTLANGLIHTAPPTRNVSEPPIQSFLAFCQLCSNAIQRATSVFDPSLGRQKSDQSGRAIQELQEQSVEGNFHWSDSLTITLTHYYRAVADLVQNEYDQPQVMEIIRPDGEAEQAEINREFDAGTDAQGKPIRKHHNIRDGNFAFAVSIGRSAETQRQAAAVKIDALIKVLPPQMVAEAADLIAKLHDLGPLGDAIADRWIPPQYRDANDPKAATAKLAQAMQQNQQLQQIVQKLSEAIRTKRPELELKKYLGELSALTSLRVAQEKNMNDQAQRDSNILEMKLGFAHDMGMQGEDHDQEQEMQESQQQHERDTQGADHGQEQVLQGQQLDADAEQEQAQPTE